MISFLSHPNTNPTLLFSMPSGGEWIWIVLIVFLLFGAKKIPELAKGLGSGIRNFNDAKKGQDDTPPAVNHTPPSSPAA